MKIGNVMILRGRLCKLKERANRTPSEKAHRFSRRNEQKGQGNSWLLLDQKSHSRKALSSWPL